MTPTRLPLLSNSSLNTFRRCPREYYFRYVLLRKGRAKAAALRFGTLFHVALNAWWIAPNLLVDPSTGKRGRTAESLGLDVRNTVVRCSPEDRLTYALDALAEHVAKQDNESDEFELVKAQCLIAGYTARWGDEGYETVAVELQFRLPIMQTDEVKNVSGRVVGTTAPYPMGYDLGGAIDVIVRRGGRTRNVEHKTTSADISVGSNYWRHVVTLDPQVSTYMHASRVLGFNPHDTLYDVIRKPAIIPLLATPEEDRLYTKPTKKEPTPRLYKTQREHDETPQEFCVRLTEDIATNPNRYFQRMPIVRLEEDDAEHARDVRDTATMIHFAETHGTWPRAPSACERFGRLCEYHDACSGITTIADDSRFITKQRQHEELDP